MKAPPFQYARAESTAETLALLAQYKDEALVLAGGQSLMPMLNMCLASPFVLIDIHPLDELAGIRLGGGILYISAMTRHREVAESPLVREHLPLIAQAMRHVAHPAIRNRGAFGGSFATADPSAEMPACCVALGARILLESTRGRRSVAAGDFFRGIHETAREADELRHQRCASPARRAPVAVADDAEARAARAWRNFAQDHYGPGRSGSHSSRSGEANEAADSL
jgi:carbon-monoxide dehydrogenase medium subunit